MVNVCTVWKTSYECIDISRCMGTSGIMVNPITCAFWRGKRLFCCPDGSPLDEGTAKEEEKVQDEPDIKPIGVIGTNDYGIIDRKDVIDPRVGKVHIKMDVHPRISNRDIVIPN